MEQLVGAIDVALIELHGERRRTLGATASGLFSHYTALMERGAILQDDEITACRLVQQSLPAFSEYAVLRAGLGELAFLLNGIGLRVAACEPNEMRFEALQAGLDHLAAAQAVDRSTLRTAMGYFPDRIEARPALAIATVFVFDLPLEEDQAFCRGLRQFDALLVNPRLFIRVREQQSAQRAVTAFLQSLGFAPVDEFAEGRMIYFERSTAEWDKTTRNIQEAIAVPKEIERSHADPKASDENFTHVVARLMALVPPASPINSDTTWIDRRGQKSDLRSALGDEK